MADPLSQLGQMMQPYWRAPQQAVQQWASAQQPPDLLHRMLLTGMGYSWEPQDATKQYPYVPPGVTQIPETASRTWRPPGEAAAKRPSPPPTEKPENKGTK
jgi:hypothetical protein